LCRCRICHEARIKGVPYARAGPSAFLHDINLLIDTPAEIGALLDRSAIHEVDYLLYSHLDPDHVEGSRVVEQITLDFRTWRAYPGKTICLLLPSELGRRLDTIQSQYGPTFDYYRRRGFLEVRHFEDRLTLDGVDIVAIPVDRGNQTAYVYTLEKAGRKVVYAPCDIKPFPEEREEVRDADLLVIQPGIFEDGLKHGFRYPADHISRTTLYTFDQTRALAQRIRAKKTVFVHLEEYWNRSHDDYLSLEPADKSYCFAYDGMEVDV